MADEKRTADKQSAGVGLATESSVESAPATHVVDFEPGDAADPLNWPAWYKWSVVVALSLMSAFVQLAIVIAAPVAPQIEAALGTRSATYETLLVTIWELGEVVGPLVYSPLTERVGRLPVLHATGAVFVAFSAGCALAGSAPALVALRFCNGASVAVVSISGAVVGDLFAREHRGPALSVMMLGSRAGPALGPIVGSYLGERAGWRWAFWLTTIVSGAGACAFAALYRETYRVKILERRVRALRRATGNAGLRSKYQREGGAAWQPFLQAVFRPAYLISHSWILVGLSAYVSVYLGLFYLVLTTIATAFEEVYGFSEGQTGLAYLGLYVGMIVGSVFFTTVSKMQVKRSLAPGGKSIKPEQRLVPSTAAGTVISLGFFLFGWTLAYHTHWMGPIVGTGLIGFGYFITTVSVRSYIVDAFGIYAASASGAMFAVRNVSAALLPLVGPPLFRRLGLGWGSSLLGFLGVAMVPIPLFFIKYGEGLRRKSALLIQE